MQPDDRFGWVELAPADPVVAGSLGTWHLTYHAGLYGIDDGGRLKLAWKFISDWGQPQTTDPIGLNYLTATTSADARLHVRWDGSQHGHMRPREKAVIVDISQGAVAPGDTITLTYGDTSHGSAGTMAQTFCERAMDIVVVVDPFGTGRGKELAVRPTITIINGSPSRLVAIAPSMAELGEPFTLRVRAEDHWGNPCRDFMGPVHAQIENTDHLLPPLPESPGVYGGDDYSLQAYGVHEILVRCGDLSAESNPISCLPDAAPSFTPFWGDLHAQGEPDGVNDLGDFFTFARDYAFLDFVGHQGNCFSTSREKWQAVQDAVARFHSPGSFVSLLGYEYSATPSGGGDRNVYFVGNTGPLHRTSHEMVSDTSDEETDRYPVTELFATFESASAAKGQAHPGVLMVPHVGGRPCNLRWHSEPLEPVIEIASTWGEFEWVLRETIERGYVMGFVAGSDDHTGRPGAAFPASIESGIYGGLTCVYARELTREALFEALFSRRCYATSGQRILLRVQADGHWMGEVIACDRPPKFEIDVVGTAVIERIEVFRGLTCVFSHPEPMPRAEGAVRISWSGARTRGRGRLTSWDGRVQVQGGRILGARAYAFDTPAEAITECTESEVRWRSTTAGDSDGVLLNFEGSDALVFEFETDLLRRTVTLGELRQGPLVIELGGADLQVVFELAPLGTGERRIELAFTDSMLPSDLTPYWVRVTQIDGAKAWASPIFVSARHSRSPDSSQSRDS